MVGVVVIAYNETIGEFEREAERTLQREFDQVVKQYSEAGLRTVSQDLILRSSGQGPLVYVLAGASGEVAVGDFGTLPVTDVTTEPRHTSFRAEVDNGQGRFESARIKAYVGRLAVGGPILLVGQDMTVQDSAADRIRRQLFLGLGVGLLIALLAGLAAGRMAALRAAELSQTTRDVMAGDLNRRARISGRDDEFNRLAEDLNAMLDALQKLVIFSRSRGDAIAHDLRSPLTRMRNRMEAALAKTPDSADDRAALESTIQEADRLLAVFNAVLEIAGMEGRTNLAFHVVDLRDVAREFVEFYEPLAEDAGLTLRLAAMPQATPVRGDARLLGRAVSNLIENALKYTPAGGEIVVEARPRADGAMEILVEDDGPGIPAARRSHVVDRFARLEDHRDAPGAGLGLSLVAAIAKAHDGKLELRDGRRVRSHAGGCGLGAALVLPAWGVLR